MIIGIPASLKNKDLLKVTKKGVSTLLAKCLNNTVKVYLNNGDAKLDKQFTDWLKRVSKKSEVVHWTDKFNFGKILNDMVKTCPISVVLNSATSAG